MFSLFSYPRRISNPRRNLNAFAKFVLNYVSSSDVSKKLVFFFIPVYFTNEWLILGFPMLSYPWLSNELMKVDLTIFQIALANPWSNPEQTSSSTVDSILNLVSAIYSYHWWIPMLAQMRRFRVRLVHCEQKPGCSLGTWLQFNLIGKRSLQSDKWKSNGLWRDVQQYYGDKCYVHFP